MAKRKLHFVYAVPHAAYYKALSFGKTPLYRKYWKYILKWPNPISAPFSITYNILKALEQYYEIWLYDVNEKVSIELGATEIFLGHFWPDEKTKKPGTNYWTSYDESQVTNKVLLDYPFDKRIYVITPFNHSIDQMGWAIPLLQNVHCYIGICGDYWVQNLKASSFGFLNGRMLNINMGIDSKRYPKIKRQFNEPGKRKFLYIGRVSAEKNIVMLEDLAKHFKGFEGGYIGNGTIKGWKQIASAAALTPQYMAKLAEEYDFFINTSTYDAQATTILEAMSWGFVVACTPETGYTESSIFELSTHDVQSNLKVLNQLSYMDNAKLDQVVNQNQVLLKSKFTWEQFAQKLQNVISKEVPN